MDRKLISQLENEADKHERLAKAMRNMVQVMLESDSQEPLPISGEGISVVDDHIENPSAAIRAVAEKIEGNFEVDEVQKMLRAEFPAFHAKRDKISFVLWRMARKGNLRIIEKGTPHRPTIYSRP